MRSLQQALLFALTLGFSHIACGSPSIYGGYLPASDNGNTLYYYFVESLANPASDPVTLWLSGGPGVSSLTGAFLENGPYNCWGNASVTENKYSWNQNSNMLYVDQPAGSGFSYVGSSSSYVTSEEQLAEELYNALLKWFEYFPQYKKNPFFIFGESYAGKYIPSIATAVHLHNSRAPSFKINLKGLGIGDGWVNPYTQAISEVPWAVNMGLLGSDEAAECQKKADEFAVLYEEAVTTGDDELYKKAATASEEVTGCVCTKAGNVDQYDVRYYNGDPLDPRIDGLTTYLSDPDVKKSLNATTRWTFANEIVQLHLRRDIVRPSEQLIPSLLKNYPIIIYSGQFDLVCNLRGTEELLSNLMWEGLDKYLTSSQVPWLVNGQMAGFSKTADTLTHTIVLAASHQVPAAQPENSLYMFNTFLNKYK